MNRDHCLNVLFALLVVGVVLGWRHAPSDGASGEWTQILKELRYECDPNSPGTDYRMTQTSQPTERRREAITQRCRDLGAALLPLVRIQIALESDEEMRGMLTVVAAALGDADSTQLAAQQMVWSDSPALRISAAKTLRRLRDPRTLTWFKSAIYDHHFVVNGGCGTHREQYFPVRAIAQAALREMLGEWEPEEVVRQRILREKIEQAEMRARLILEQEARMKTK